MACEIVLDLELSFLMVVLHVTLKSWYVLYFMSLHIEQIETLLPLTYFPFDWQKNKKQLGKGVRIICCETWTSDRKSSICWSLCLSRPKPCYKPNDDGYSSKDWSNICSNIPCAQPTSDSFGSPNCAGLACTGRGIGSKRGFVGKQLLSSIWETYARDAIMTSSKGLGAIIVVHSRVYRG